MPKPINNRLALLFTPILLFASLSIPVFSEAGRSEQENHLSQEKSLYLQQHVNNPVDWYPWAEEAFAKARTEEKPIFLSVGFATCYWCHRMAEESFCDAKVAAFMNENFVNIKVDREELPEVDQIYMSFIQSSTGSFGWPISAFLTPDLEPFFGGSYFERDPFFDQLKKISKEWRKSRKSVLDAAARVSALMKKLHTTDVDQPVEADLKLLEDTYQWYMKAYDAKNGGFGTSPKFPLSEAYDFLLRYHLLTGKRSPITMVRNSLKRMAEGAVRDHLDGGFHRFSIDPAWRVPQFEKLLFIQAQLAITYLDAYQATRDPVLGEASKGILGYVLSELQSPEGAFFSARDATNECGEIELSECKGRFYLWKEEEVRRILGSEADLFLARYGMRADGNFVSEDSEQSSGWNVLFINETIDQLSKRFELSSEVVLERLEESRTTLLALRALRPRPVLDDKVLAGWNGLMVSAFAKGYQVFRNEEYLKAATRAAGFIMDRMYDRSTRVLKRRYRGGDLGIDGFVDDYAFVAQGLLDLYEASLDERWLLNSLDLTERQIELFWDSENGGFFNAAKGERDLPVRMKELFDGIEPSPNGVSALTLLRFSQLTKNPQWEDMVRKMTGAFSVRLSRTGQSMTQLKASLTFLHGKPKQIIVVGRREEPGTQAILDQIHKRFLPFKVVYLKDGGQAEERLGRHLEVLESMVKIGGKPTAYVCENYVCRLPTNDPVKVGHLLDGDAQRISSLRNRPLACAPFRADGC